MSECPSTSLVKMPSQRVAELCLATIESCQAARAARIAPLEEAITAEVERRAASKRRWFRKSAEREAVIRDLSEDWSWRINFMFARDAYTAQEKRAERLLAASRESGEIWVSTGDLWMVLP